MESKSMFWSVFWAVALGPIGLFFSFPRMGKWLVGLGVLNIFAIIFTVLEGSGRYSELAIGSFIFFGIVSYPFSIVYAFIASLLSD